MNTQFDFGSEKGERIAYIRSVAVADLPSEVQAQAGGLAAVWAVHDGGGARLALVSDRKLAFILARQNNLDPVSTH